jgi:hypothetical protein
MEHGLIPRIVDRAVANARVIRQAPEAAGDWIAKHISVHAAARMPSSRVGSIYSDSG